MISFKLMMGYNSMCWCSFKLLLQLLQLKHRVARYTRLMCLATAV